jgi:hypothetical protein
VCEKHNKTCSYLRPTKRRGPQKGYRTALNTYKESAAAWGVVLGAIPGLDALIEGHLRSESGRYLLKSVKDPTQQDALIQKWQQSTVFKTFFPSTGSVASVEGEEAEPEPEPEGTVLDMDQVFAIPRAKQQPQKPSPIRASRASRSSFGPVATDLMESPIVEQHPVIREPTSLSDIVAKDAARSCVPTRPFCVSRVCLWYPANLELARLMLHKHSPPSALPPMRQSPTSIISAQTQNRSPNPPMPSMRWAPMRNREYTTNCLWDGPSMTRSKLPKPKSNHGDAPLRIESNTR